ncbi:YicC/YloC family endoribonuclease [Sulfuriroseicoccus oceanibius]|uniref:YicC family protein n=1 Tax=Sulfuriroseicoccus oceanibius TaxID=2707525 RepID=A0A6B3L975_9BACT|nr:YicC/YloC family endoribonuclease [Sulfuriroseicoccus oceanibius]QQL45565.1 YicC family protein [Sulfuriroseicoccus oceanibius]
MAATMSMTGFGRGDAHSSDEHSSVRVTVEISSVNRKQLDIVVNLPRDLQNLEPIVRKQLAASASRGRITAKVIIERESGPSQVVTTNPELFAQFRSALAELTDKPVGDVELSDAEIVRLPGVITIEDASVEATDLTEPLTAATAAAISQWNDMRASEGDHLVKDLLQRLDIIRTTVNRIAERSPEVVAHWRKQLHERLQKAGVDLPQDDDRLLAELTLFADRSDISEETTRLDCHFAKFLSLIEADEPCGRPLDFLLQEMHRECNTIGSKANDAEIAQGVVTCKTELEKIREQVQNLE